MRFAFPAWTAGRSAGLATGLAFLLNAAGLAHAAPDEVGRPIVRNYTPGEEVHAMDNHLVVQDAAGVMVFGDGANLITYDGAHWHYFLLPKESAGARQFAVAADGTIYLAGADVLGYLHGAGAQLAYVSLIDRLPAAQRNVEELRYATAIGDTVYFSDEEKILIWREPRFTVIPYPTPPGAQGARLHRVGDELYVTALDRPLCRLVHDTLEPVADDPVLRENQIITVEAGAAKGTLTLLTAERGFFQLTAGHVAPLPTPANRWLVGKRIFRALRLRDGSRAVAFSAASGDGGARFDPDGHYRGPIDMSIGLVVKAARDFFQDREGGLWVGLDHGSARLVWPSPASVFDLANGLGYGAVADVARADGVLYAKTDEGVFRLVPGDDNGHMAHFERTLAPPADAFAANKADARWRASSGAVFQIQPDGTTRALPSVIAAAAGAIARLHEEPGPNGPVLWIAGARGLVRVEIARAFVRPMPFATLLTAEGVRADEQLPTEHAPIGFSFIAPRQNPAAALVYQTRLVGLDRDWSVWDAKRERSFPHLPSGHYRFEVRARDADGELSAPASLAFVVLPPWWFTSWAIVAYVFSASAVLVGSVRLRTRALRQRAERLEVVVADRTAELARQNKELVRLNQLELDEKVSARLAEEKARLEVLRYQLNPHFLFNTLASISASLPTGSSTARVMVERLAEFCRLTLHRGDDREWTTLGSEMKLLRAYLDIERSRWGELLDVEFSCDAGLEHEQLPHFLILPILENALKYGRATSPDRVGLRLATHRGADGALVVEVANTGEWIEPTAKKTVSSLGIGLDNLRERLVRHYPRAHRLEISHAAGWVTVTLHILPQSAV